MFKREDIKQLFMEITDGGTGEEAYAEILKRREKEKQALLEKKKKIDEKIEKCRKLYNDKKIPYDVYIKYIIRLNGGKIINK